MKSSTGVHYVALDHVRALAAFMVVVWHFAHATTGYPVPFEHVPAFFPMALLDEGHTGVALFMTLSGYLFARLLNGKSIVFSAFVWNRVLRLLPLLALVVLIAGVKELLYSRSLVEYARLVVGGLVMPSLPNGGWSITVEFHYYLLLPLLLWAQGRTPWALPAAVVGAVALRLGIFLWKGEVQELAYSTLVGRFDQFALGMIACHFRTVFQRRHMLAVLVGVAFAVFYWQFDRLGGGYRRPPTPILAPMWIFLPTIEGLAYAVVFQAARLVHERVMDISDFNLAVIWSLGFYLLMVGLGYLSFTYVESPFLKFRKRYVVVETSTKENAS
jgi:peptidoglycan/LPS O-acetylase OafA/YrhL